LSSVFDVPPCATAIDPTSKFGCVRARRRIFVSVWIDMPEPIGASAKSRRLISDHTRHGEKNTQDLLVKCNGQVMFATAF
jgi:hypothetical protein